MWHQLSMKLVQYMAPVNLIRPPDVSGPNKGYQLSRLNTFYFQPPIEEIVDDEKSARKSPPDSDKSKERERDVSLSMAPLPIPLGPLGFGGKLMLANNLSSRPITYKHSV